MPFPPSEAITSFPKLVSIDLKSTRGVGSYALYTLVPIHDMRSFLAAVAKDDNTVPDYVVLPPNYDFSGRTFADIMEYHIALTVGLDNPDASHNSINHAQFLVAIHEDLHEHGVLLVDVVYENYSDTEAVPMLARCRVAKPESVEGDEEDDDEYNTAVSWLVNIELGNMDMHELLDTEITSWPTELPGYSDLRVQLDEALSDHKQRARDRFSQLPRRTGVYMVHHVADKSTRNCEVEPDCQYKEDCEMYDRIATNDLVGSIHCWRMPQKSTEELLQQVRREHPVKCQKNPDHLNKYWMFVFDKEVRDNRVEVALVKVKWDGVTEGKTKEELESLMPELEVVERCRVEEALERMDRLSGFS